MRKHDLLRINFVLELNVHKFYFKMVCVLNRDRSLLFLLFLLGLCAVQGLIITRGVEYPPDLDAWRDIGLTQAILDGNWFGDPTYPGEVRHYPPLVPGLMAVLFQIIGADDLLLFWVRAGVWLGLVPVFMFFFMARAMLGPRAACVGTALFVLLNSVVTPPWIGGGYSPWLLIPLLAQAFFFGTLWLIHSLVTRGGWLSAGAIGAAIGVTFLAHTVPGLLLVGIFVITVLLTREYNWATVAWLAISGTCTFVLAAPYIVPLALSYPGGIIHLPPGAYTERLLQPNIQATITLFILNIPLLIGIIINLVRKSWPNQKTLILLSAWIGLCAFMLFRHYMCAAFNITNTFCATLRIPVHHYHLYFQAAAPLVIGMVFSQVTALRGGVRISLSFCVIIGMIVFINRPYDVGARNWVVGNQSNPFGRSLDLYRWLRTSAPGNVVYITLPGTPLGPVNESDDPEKSLNFAPFIVMAAAKPLLVANPFFSNPYVDWESRHQQRNSYFNWIMGFSQIAPDTRCLNMLLIIPYNDTVVSARANLLWRGAYYGVFQIDRTDCLPS
jgi:hypothetical protein